MLERLLIVSVKVEDSKLRVVRFICGLSVYFWFGKLGLDVGRNLKFE